MKTTFKIFFIIFFIFSFTWQDVFAGEINSKKNNNNDKKLPFLETYHPNYASYDTSEGLLKYQISFKTNIWEKGHLFISYTQLSLWDMSTDSVPFIETNYLPEIFYKTNKNYFHNDRHFFTVKAGASHNSNGLEGTDSRSWNYGYLESTATFNFNNSGKEYFKLGLRVWPVTQKSDENKDILDYYGYGELNMEIDYKNIELTFRGRKGKRSDAGLVELNLFYHKDKFYLSPFIQYFKGHGETLLKYNKSNERISAGILLYL